MSTKFYVKTILLFICTIGQYGSLLAQEDSLRLSIDNVFDLAMEKNREIKLSKAYLSRAEIVVQDKKNNRLPTANFSATAGYLTDVGVLGLGTMSTGFYPMPHFSNSYAMQASVSLYTGGRLTTDINIAELERGLASLNIQKNAQSVKIILVGYYLDLYQLYQQKKVYEKNIALGKELLEKIKDRYQTGIALKSDRIRNELLLSTFELALTNLKEHIAIANNNIVSTLSLPENTVIIPDSEIELSTNIGQMLLLPTSAELQKSALQKNTANREAELKIAMADKRLKLVRSSNRPELSLFLSGALTRPYTFDIPAKDIYANTNAIGVKLNFPISNLYLAKKKIEIASKDIDISRLNKELTEETITRDVSNQFIKCREVYNQLTTLYKQQELADENYRRISDNYIEQLALNTEVMDASNQKLEAGLRVTQARVQILYTYYQLLKTLGEL